MNAELERMKSELEKEGYIIQLEELLVKGRLEIIAPDGWYYIDNEAYQNGATLNEMIEISAMEAIEKAYSHLEEKRAYEAMVSLLARIIEWDERFKHYPQSFIKEAKTLLDSLPKAPK